jgi:hypothetical protein
MMGLLTLIEDILVLLSLRTAAGHVVELVHEAAALFFVLSVCVGGVLVGGLVAADVALEGIHLW